MQTNKFSERGCSAVSYLPFLAEQILTQTISERFKRPVNNRIWPASSTIRHTISLLVAAACIPPNFCRVFQFRLLRRNFATGLVLTICHVLAARLVGVSRTLLRN